MTYMSNSGCCGNYSGCSSGGLGGYSSSSSSSYSSIDSIISSYSGSSMSMLESSVDYTRSMPVPVMNMDANTSNNMEVLDYKKEQTKQGKGYNIPYNTGYSINKNNMKDDFSQSTFLRSDRPKAQFIGNVQQIQSYIQEAFAATTGKELPQDISIEVVSQEELRERHDIFNSRSGESRWSPGIQGFSINRRGFGQSLIFVKENDLDLLMMVIGHEIGHVVNFQLDSRLNEEAKAFAFEMAWVKAVYEKNIAGLKNSINPDPMPAKNGLHDVAFDFVKKLLLLGKDAFDIFNGLMRRELSITDEVQYA